jgi:DNA-binding MarR family transcriptional regulator
MGMEPTGMSRLLKALDDEGYIMRKPDKADKRKVWIHLTPKGKKYRDITKQYVIALNKHMQTIIPPDDLATFFRVIDTINNELDRVKIAY